MSNMFKVNGKTVKTFNPITGCSHNCSYCFAKPIAENMKQRRIPKYKNGFKPTFHPNVANQKLGKDKTYFVVDMGDMWCEEVKLTDIAYIINACKKADSSNTFYFLTKNPSRYVEYFSLYPNDYKDNFVLGATIETNRNIYEVSKAPNSLNRSLAMMELPDHFRKFISIEPIMDFDLIQFEVRLRNISPDFCYVGYDNHNHDLVEPSLEKTEKFIEELEKFTEVRIKNLKGTDV